MASSVWQPVCQWCGKTGTTASNSNGTTPPTFPPIVSGNCPSHPSGKSDAKHGPQWQQR